MRRAFMLRRDVVGGSLLTILGVSYAVYARRYGFGSMQDVGPGLVPVALGCLLAVLGISIAATAAMKPAGRQRQEDRAFTPNWKGLVFIVLGTLAFILLCQTAGLVIATFSVVFITALGDRGNNLKASLILALCVTAAGVLIFYFGLQVHIPLLPGVQQ